MSRPILTTQLRHESDLVIVRRRAKRIAQLLGFDARDQTRLATAVSEIARNAIIYAQDGRAEFLIDGDSRSDFLVRISDRGPGIADLDAVLQNRLPGVAGQGITGARRLVDRFSIRSSPAGTCVELGKALPHGSIGSSPGGIRAIADLLAQERSDDPLTALREQSHELLQSLTESHERQEELARLNRELEVTNRGVVALYAELDERAEQLRLASEHKSAFLANMSHEFRTPLSSILGLSRLLMDRTDGELSAEQERQVRYIRQSAEGLLDLVNDLLDLAKVEAGRIEVRPGLFTTDDLFAGLRGALKPLLTSDAIDLVFEDAGDLPVFWTDQAKVGQILRNFISNALKFTERGEVRVAATHNPSSGRAEFSVRDTGIGIATENQERIFQEFIQVESRMSARSKGTGLGLPLSRRLAGLLGGEVRVESVPGEGSTFFLTVPTDYGEDGSTDAPPPLRARKSALIVDDDGGFRYILRQILAAEPLIHVVEAANGEDALEAIARQPPDLVVLDLQMPVVDGFAVLQALETGILRDIPVVVSTSMPLDAELRARLGRARFVVSKETLSRKGMLAMVRTAVSESRSDG